MTGRVEVGILEEVGSGYRARLPLRYAETLRTAMSLSS